MVVQDGVHTAVLKVPAPPSCPQLMRALRDSKTGNQQRSVARFYSTGFRVCTMAGTRHEQGKAMETGLTCHLSEKQKGRGLQRNQFIENKADE